jgi:putative endonuclease
MNKTKPYRQRLGKWGETRAEAFLQGKGLVSVAKNIRTHYGEIDLLMKDGDALVFVEVKTRTTLDFGTPEESITPRKKLKMVQSAEAWIQAHPECGSSWRIDVLAIFGRPGDPDPEILWFENAID